MSSSPLLEQVIFNLLLKPSVQIPISSSRILAHLIADVDGQCAVSGLKLRLSDQKKINESLERLYQRGIILLQRERSAAELHVTSLQCDPCQDSPYKRKREETDENLVRLTGETMRPSVMALRAKCQPMLSRLPDPTIQDIFALLQKPTARQRLLAEQFASQYDEFESVCEYITKVECLNARMQQKSQDTIECERIHFRPLIRPHTDPSLGHCSYLNTCYSEPTYALSPFPPGTSSTPSANASASRLNSNVSLPSGLGAGGRGKEKAPCRYLHFEVDYDGTMEDAERERRRLRTTRETERVKNGFSTVASDQHHLTIGCGPYGRITKPYPPQWINCDLRRFDYSVLGTFHVIMADPPWDIHMSLPYGTLTDDEMRAMPIPMLQDEGLLFLWVTGRAMEVGRECMRVWGYTRVDEVIWLKTNQLQRVIRTGRTGHWLNHTKEHMLIGVKTSTSNNEQTDDKTSVNSATLKFPSWINRGLDTDVIVSEVRETSRKPEEVYGLIERMCPGGRKVEIFGRKHNVRPGWLTLGNQLGNSDQIFEEELARKIKERYPERTNLAVRSNQEQHSITERDQMEECDTKV